jgi:hypothetical protein
VPIYKKVNKDFFKKWTPEMAYVLGFFAADGYMTVNRRGGQFWSIQIVDKTLLCDIREVIGSNHKISCRKGRENVKDSFRLQIGSIEMCDDLRELGFNEKKAKSMSVPNVPKRYFSDFVRGYFDGDGNVWTGYVHKERFTKLLVLRIIFTSCSNEFLSVLARRLEDRGIVKGVIRKAIGNYYRLSYSTWNALKLYDFMYNHGVNLSGGLFLGRKKKVFERYMKMRP